jgi:hypothetical protein
MKDISNYLKHMEAGTVLVIWKRRLRVINEMNVDFDTPSTCISRAVILVLGKVEPLGLGIGEGILGNV